MWKLIILNLCIFLASILLNATLYIEWWIIPLLMGVLNIVFFFGYYHQRNQRIDALNNYLTELNRGDFSHDISTYEEGELSVLQSELYKLSVTLRHQNENLLNSQKFIQDSLNDIAHQIKTPLTSIMVMIDLMQENVLPYEKQKEFTLSIQKQLNRLKNLVNELLVLAKLEAQVIQYHPVLINDKEFFRRVLLPFEIMMDLKNITLTTQYSEEDVEIDVDWTIEAFSNIVKNAIEHLPKSGHLEIISTVTPLFWRVEIQDNGPGIDASDLDHIFERFYKGKDSSVESVGIGLNMSERIIVQQNGQITVESVKDSFTKFKVEFRRRAS